MMGGGVSERETKLMSEREDIKKRQDAGKSWGRGSITTKNNEWTNNLFNGGFLFYFGKDGSERGRENTDERRESSGRAPRLGAPAKD